MVMIQPISGTKPIHHHQPVWSESCSRRGDDREQLEPPERRPGGPAAQGERVRERAADGVGEADRGAFQV